MPVDNTLLAENCHYKHTIDYTSLKHCNTYNIIQRVLLVKQLYPRYRFHTTDCHIKQ